MRLEPFRSAALMAGLFVVGCVSAPPAAYAGSDSGWRFHPERCPDLVEDARDRRESRRDERIDRGGLDRAEDRADRRESHRDERVTSCPASAWVWYGPRGVKRSVHPAAATIYFDHRQGHYYRHGPDRARVRVVIR